MVKNEEFDENLDNPEYSSKSDFSKANLASVQVLKVQELRSKEMREGYFNYDRVGNKVYVPDSRKEFISSVQALKLLLNPEIIRNIKIKNSLKEIEGKIKKSQDEFGIYTKIINNNNIVVNKQAGKHIPNLNESCLEYNFIKKNGQVIRREIISVNGVNDCIHHSYWDKMVEFYDEIFAELNKLMDINNYFKDGVNY